MKNDKPVGMADNRELHTMKMTDNGWMKDNWKV